MSGSGRFLSIALQYSFTVQRISPKGSVRQKPNCGFNPWQSLPADRKIDAQSHENTTAYALHNATTRWGLLEKLHNSG
jgi:hypothetical protein